MQKHRVVKNLTCSCGAKIITDGKLTCPRCHQPVEMTSELDVVVDGQGRWKCQKCPEHGEKPKTLAIGQEIKCRQCNTKNKLLEVKVKKYRLGIYSKDVSVFKIGEPDEWEVNPSSWGFYIYLEAESDEEAMRQAKAFLRGYEKGGKTSVYVIREKSDVYKSTYFKAIDSVFLRQILSAKREGNDLPLQYQSLFEEMKEEIRQNLKRARDEDLNRLRKEKKAIEERIEAQKKCPIPLFMKSK